MRCRTVLYRLNPTTKLIIMAIFAVPVTFSTGVWYPLCILLVLSALGYVFAGLSPARAAKSMGVFLLGALCLCVFLVLTRAMGQTGDVQIGMVGIRFQDIRRALSLALRMLGFAYAALLFARTTDPVLLALSLIHQWHIPYQAAYAFLTAYRFVPSFQEEFRKIRIAHESRGVYFGRGVLRGIVQAPAYLVPLLIHALRAGEQTAISMDARAFGLTPRRTYYKTPAYGKLDRLALLACALGVAAITAAALGAGLFAFGLGYASGL